MDSPTVGTIISLTSPVDFGSSLLSDSSLADESSAFVFSESVAGFSAADSSISQITSPIAKVSPSSALMCSLPAASAFNSNVALSDSSSQMTSSISTCSPSFLNHCAIVTSVIDSPTVGTLISKLIVLLIYAKALLIISSCSLLCILA